MNRSAHSVEPEELMAYLDGELPVERARECASHLDQCAECQRLVADLKSVDQQLNLWQVGAAPESVASTVTAEVAKCQGVPKAKQGRDLPASRWLRLRPWVWGLGGAVSALLVVAIFMPRQPVPRLGTIYKPAASESKAGPPAGDFVVPEGGVTADVESRTLQSQAAMSARPPAPTVLAWDNFLQNSGKGAQNSVSTDGQLTSEQQAPMIARTASVAVVAKDFDQSRSELDAVLRRHNGYAAQLTVDAPAGAGRSLSADLRIPAAQLDAALAEIKKLGRVEQENQGGEEVSQQYVDLNARLSNARNTEQRLVEVLNQRTGKMADVLEVENEIARVRGEIEQMDAERKSLEHRVTYAALRVQLREEYKASLNLNVAPPSGRARMRNSLVDGLGAAADSLVGFVQLLLYCSPFLLLWTLILYWPSRALWRRLRANPVAK
jgi:anti-sigma factor RsiW